MSWFYVLGSYLLTIAAMGLEVRLLLRRRRALRENVGNTSLQQSRQVQG